MLAYFITFFLILITILGVEVAKNGDKYEGEFVNGKKQGKAKFSWADGSVYEGSIANNTINGYGK